MRHGVGTRHGSELGIYARVDRLGSAHAGMNTILRDLMRGKPIDATRIDEIEQDLKAAQDAVDEASTRFADLCDRVIQQNTERSA